MASHRDRSPSSSACHRLAQCEPVVADLEVDNLAELVTALSPSSGQLSRNESAEVITAMLRSADVDALVPRAIIEPSSPGCSPSPGASTWPRVGHSPPLRRR
jgi:hypothetical protein